MSDESTIKIIAFEGRKPIADFVTHHIPEVGDMLTVEVSPSEARYYIVEKRGFFIGKEAGTGDGKLEFANIRVRLATQDEEDYWFDR